MIAGSIILSIVIQHHESKTTLFQKYGLVMFLAYYILYRTKIHTVFSRFRLFVVPAITILVISIAGTAYGFGGFEPIKEIEITTVQDQAKKKGEMQNIIMITFDGLSANRMSLYGNERPTTPVMDELAKTSYVFDNMHAEADNTTQSISAMQTGMHYSGVQLLRYGAKVAGGSVVGYLPRVFDTLGWETTYLLYSPNLHLGRGEILTFLSAYNDLPERLRKNVYGTQLQQYFLSISGRNYPITPGWIAALHNDYFSENISRVKRLLKLQTQEYTPAQRVTGPGGDKYDPALDYLANKDNPSFLWVHNYAPHQPYVRNTFSPFLDKPFNYKYDDVMQKLVWNGPPLDPQYEELAKDLRLMSEEYIAGADAALGRFLEIIKSEGVFDNFMLIISTDHGQAFEKGDMFHLTGVMYEQTARIPLIIHMPGQTEGRRIKTLASHVDLMPTVLDTLGMPVPGWMEGESLWNYIEQERDKPIERTTFSQAIPDGLSFAKTDDVTTLNTFLVYKGDYKLIYRFYANRRFEEVEPPESAQRFLERYPQVELFNLTVNPNEDHNITDKETSVRDEMLKLVKERIEITRNIRAL